MNYSRILFYHDIAASKEEKKPPKCYGPTIDDFREHMKFLKSSWNVLGIEEIEHCCGTGQFPSKPSVAITFDDGLSGVMLAAEVLLDLGLPSTVFLSTRFIESNELPWFIHLDDIVEHAKRRKRPLAIDGKEFWVAKKGQFIKSRHHAKALLLSKTYEQQIATLSEWAESVHMELGESRQGDHTFLTWDQIAELASHGIQFGSHTHSHVDLRVLSDTELDQEFAKPVELIKQKLGERHSRFVSYPDGRFDERVIDVAKKYHRAGFAVMSSSSWEDIYRIPRRGIYRTNANSIEYVLSQRYYFSRWLKNRASTILSIYYDGI